MEREKIKNALSKSDLKTLLKITKCYNKDNGLSPIYENCESSIKELRDCGYTVDEVQVQDFAFLTPNRYSGVSGQNELGVDIDTELVPYVEANYTTYANDLHIDDDATLFNTEWLKDNWHKAIGHEGRFINLIRIADKVKKEDEDLADKLYDIAKKYDDDPYRYSYNWAKEEFYKVFKDNVPDEEKEISPERKLELKKEALKVYNQTYNKSYGKYKEIANSWQEKLTPLIESGREEAFKKKLNELSGNQNKSKETIEDLTREFKDIFDFKPTKEEIREFAAKEEIDGLGMFECFKATFEAFKNGVIDFDKAVRYFNNVRRYPDSYLEFAKEWYEEPMTESEKEEKEFREREREREANLEMESDDEKVNAIKEYIKTNLPILLNSGKKEWIEYWERDKKSYLALYKEGKITELEHAKGLKKTLDYCLVKSGIREEKKLEKENSDFKKMEEKVFKAFEYNNDQGSTALVHFRNNHRNEENEKSYKLLIKKLFEALKNNKIVASDFKDLDEEGTEKVFEAIIRTDTQAEKYKKIIETVSNEKKSEN